MFKFLRSLIKYIFVIFFLFSIWLVNAASIENVFSDINTDYEYYNELQTLYDKGMIFPDADWEFKANSYLTRAEFVWIASEVSCKRCIQPKTELYFIEKYKIPPFFDVLKPNKYFYCIADAKANNFVAWYDLDFKCDDWTYKKDDKPFCVNNYITREEALAVILRMSWILTAQQAEDIRQQIRNWVNYPDLAVDLKSKLDDWKVYSFYPDFQKALDYEVVDVDLDWNTKILKLIEKDNGYLYPNQDITKQDFLKMAYVALKANNSCIQLEENSLALEMQIFDKQCSENTIKTCKLSDLTDPDDTFDFNSVVKWVCEKWIDPDNWYIWRFYHEESWEQIIKRWKYIDNYKFLSTWKWLIFLRVTDNCGNTAEVFNTIYINDDNENDANLWLKIDANPLTWYWPLSVDLEWIVDWGKWPYTYKWDFWDWDSWEWKDINHMFTDPWVYTVKLIVNDSEWREAEAMVTINVEEKEKDLNMWLKIEANPISWYWPLSVDLEWIVDWGKWPYTYKWDFWDWDNWEWKDINHIFTDSWVYTVKLIVTDSEWREVESYVDINVMKKEYLDVSIDADPLIWPWPLEVDLKWLVNWSNGPFTYSWDFWDWSTWEWENIKHIFNNKWVYEVILTVVDNDWRTWTATVLIKVTDDIDCETDSDWDWVNNCIDKCLFVKWEAINSGCPIFDKYCKADCSCDEWYVCWDNNPQTCSSALCKPKPIILSSCLSEYKTRFTWITFGNAVCESCPCENNRFLDFVSALRFCDTIFPAITSPDERKIYKRWNIFQIK